VKTAKELYPDWNEGFLGPSDYTPIINDIGKVLLRYDESNYSGDTFLLMVVETDNFYKLAYVEFGWGSCSGCDALQGCESYREIDEVYASIAGNIKTFESKENAIEYFNSAEFLSQWQSNEKREFVELAIAYLKTGADTPSF
jgi:hypothetical protein